MPFTRPLQNDVAIAAPSESLPSKGERRVVFVAIEELRTLPDDGSVACAVAPLTSEGRLLFGNTPIAEVS